MSKFLGGVIGFFVGGFVVFMLFVIIVTAVAGPLSSAEMTAGGFIIVLFSPVAALLGAIMGAVTGVRIVSTEAKRGSSFERHGNGMRCNRCGSELIGPGRTLPEVRRCTDEALCLLWPLHSAQRQDVTILWSGFEVGREAAWCSTCFEHVGE